MVPKTYLLIPKTVCKTNKNMMSFDEAFNLTDPNFAVIRQESDALTQDILEYLEFRNGTNVYCYTVVDNPTANSTATPIDTPTATPSVTNQPESYSHAIADQETNSYVVAETNNPNAPTIAPAAVVPPNNVTTHEPMSSETTTENNAKPRKPISTVEELEFQPYELNGRLFLGPYGTSIATSKLEEVKWNVTTLAVRKMLRLFFSRDVLATHTLSGKPSPG